VGVREKEPNGSTDKEDEMNEIDTTDLEMAIKQYEEAIAFEVANPWDGSLKARAIPYCYIPSKIKSKIEDGRADYLEEITKLYDQAMFTLQAAR
jgi:hypothetical protein